MEDIKQPSEVGMMHTFDGDEFFSLMHNTWIRDYGASSKIMINDTSLFDVIDINKLIHLGIHIDLYYFHHPSHYSH